MHSNASGPVWQTITAVALVLYCGAYLLWSGWCSLKAALSKKQGAGCAMGCGKCAYRTDTQSTSAPIKLVKLK